MNLTPDRAVVPNEKLMRWASAVSWGIIQVKREIQEAEKYGISSTYVQRQLEELQDLEMFLSMHWDDWMRRLEGEIHETHYETLEELMKEVE